MIRLHLPWPPSVNHYWNHIPFRTKRRDRWGQPIYIVRAFISHRGQEFRQEVGECLAVYGRFAPISDRLAVKLTLNPPNRRQWDIDNFHKAVLDSLTHAKVWKDDEQIDLLLTKRGVIRPGGSCVVEISRMR